MDEKDFKKHLQDLAHGNHHPAEHDWADATVPAAKVTAAKPAARKTAARKRKASSHA